MMPRFENKLNQLIDSEKCFLFYKYIQNIHNFAYKIILQLSIQKYRCNLMSQVNMILKLRRTFQNSYCFIHSTSFTHQLRLSSNIFYHHNFQFSTKNTLFLSNNQQKLANIEKFDKYPDSFSAVSSVWKQQGKTFNYQNPYIQQKNPRQVMEQGFLAFFISYAIRKINLQKIDIIFQNGSFYSIRQILLQLKNHLKNNQDESFGLKNENVNQIFQAFEIGKGINLPKEVFGQNQISKTRYTDSGKIVFNTNSATTAVFNYVNSLKEILVGDFGIGKSFGHALNSFLSFLMWKFLVLYKENANDLMKKLIERHKEAFDQFHKINLTKTQSVEELLNKFTKTRIELYFELKVDQTQQKFIRSFKIQCPEVQIGQIKQSYIRRVKAEAKQFIVNIRQQMRRHNKQEYFVIIIDQSDIYFRLMKQLVEDQRYVLQKQDISVYQDGFQIIKFREPYIYLQERKRLFQAYQINHFLRAINILNPRNRMYCFSQQILANVFQINRNKSEVLTQMFNPFDYGYRGPTLSNKIMFNQKQNKAKCTQIWDMFFFQLHNSAYKILQKQKYQQFVKNSQLLNLKQIIFSMSSHKIKTVSKNHQIQMVQKYVWPKIMKLSVFRELLQEDRYIFSQFSSLCNLIVYSQIKTLKTKEFIQKTFLILIEKIFFRIQLKLFKLQPQYTDGQFSYVKLPTLPIETMRQIYLQFLKEQYNIAAKNNQQLQQLRVSLISNRFIFQTMTMKFSWQASQTEYFTPPEKALIYQLLHQVQIFKKLQYRIQKLELIIQNPRRIFSAHPNHSKSIREIQTIFNLTLVQDLTKGWQKDKTDLETLLRNIITHYITSTKQSITIGKVFNIVNSKFLHFPSFDYLTTEQNRYKKFKSHHLKQIQEEKFYLKIGQSLAFRPRQDDYDYQNQGKKMKVFRTISQFDFIIVTKISDNKFQFLRVFLSFNKNMQNINNLIQKKQQFYETYVRNNDQFKKVYNYKHYFIFLQSVCKQIQKQKISEKSIRKASNLSKDLKQKQQLICEQLKQDNSYECKIISVSNISLDANLQKYSEYFLIKNLLQYLKTK